MKILIVDDEKAVLEMYQDNLVREGFEVILASSGQEGLVKARDEKPDLILLDIIMPRLNGFDVLRELKSNPETAPIPVYLLTNLPQEAAGEKCKQLGGEGYLVKAEYEPGMISKLIKKIKKL